MSLTNLVLNWWYGLHGKFPETIRFDAISGQSVGSSKTISMWQNVIDVTPDGSFGPATDQATRAWQNDHGIDPDGVVGPLTWTAAMKGVGNAGSPKPVSGPPAGTRPLPQAVANQAAITAFAIETLHNRAIQMGDTDRRTINGVDVLARIEPHTWTHRNGVLVTGLNPPIRGVTLYEITDPSQFGWDGPNRTYTVSQHGGEYGTQTDQGGRMASVGHEPKRGLPDKYKIKW